MKKALAILLAAVVCALIAVVSIPFLAVAKNIDTAVYGIDTAHLISHTIDGKDEVNVSVSHMVESFYEAAYHLSIQVMRDNSANSDDAKSSKYEISNMSLTFSLDEDEIVFRSYVGADCEITQDSDNIYVTTDSDHINLDLIIIGEIGTAHNISLKYDINGKGFNHLSHFESIETPLTLVEAYTNDNNYERLEAERAFIEDLRSRPEGKEVSIFKDNTSDCYYFGYKEIGYDFEDLHRSFMIPEDWNGFRFYRDYPVIENQLTGTPVYDGQLPFEINDNSAKFKNEPMTQSTFFLAETPWRDTENILAGYDGLDSLLNKYDYETYTDKKGRSMKVYFLDGLPKFAVYDDFFNLCIVFNLKSEDQIPIVVNMINSVEISLSSDAKFALNKAEMLGYTIIPPEE